MGKGAFLGLEVLTLVLPAVVVFRLAVVLGDDLELAPVGRAAPLGAAVEGVLEPTAAPRAVPGVQGHAAAASPSLHPDHQHLPWGPETAQPGPGQSCEAGSQPRGALGLPSPPHSSSALLFLLGTACPSSPVTNITPPG